MSELRFKLEKAVLWVGVALIGAGLCDGQTQVHLQTQGRAVDFANTASTRPAKVGSSLPASCLTGEQYHLVTAPNGQNLYLCASMNTWAAVSDGFGGGGASAVEGLSDCRFTRSSAQVLIMSACRVRIGTLIWSFPDTSFTLGSGSPADSVYFFVLNGSLVAGYGLGSTVVSGSGFSSQSGVIGFPPESLPLARWNATVTPGAWNSTGEDMRALLQRSVVEPGIGLMAADHPTTGVRTLAIDTATTPQFTSGTAAPPAGCSVGQIYARTSTNQVYHCASTSTWSEVTQPASTSGTAAPPAGCSTGQTYARTSTNQAYYCTSANTWIEVTQPEFLSGATAPPAGCAVGQIYSRTDTNQSYHCTSLNTWTELSQPAVVERIQSAAARCRTGVADAQANLPAAMAPTAGCESGTNTLYGVLRFPDTDGEYSIQDSLRLPANWTGAIDFSLTWRTADTGGNSVVWQLQTACAGDGESGDPAWNTPQAIVDAVSGSGNAFNPATLYSVAVTGCSAGETLFWRLARDRGHASDTLAAAADLIAYEWTLRRTQ